MYMQQELRLVTEYKQAQAVDRIHRRHSLMPGQPGFVRAICCRYLGHPNIYAWFRFWDSLADSTAFGQSPALKAFSATRPENIYGPQPDAIIDNAHWESVHIAETPRPAPYLLRRAMTVPAGNEAAFVTLQEEYARSAIEMPAIGSLVTLRCGEAGAEQLYLTMLRAVDREAVNLLLEGSSHAIHREAVAKGLFEVRAQDCYLIVDEVKQT